MIRCIAIDDEPIALSILQKYCDDYGGIDLKSFDCPLEGIECAVADPPHIVFLDIEMYPLNGLVLARSLPKETALIFTTAYRQYAMEGFELNAVDYMQKPLLYPRFEKAMEKAKRWLKMEDDAITLNVEHQKVRVNLSDILYVEAMDNYVKIHREGLPTVMTLMSMKEIMEMLPSDRFARIHRSYIIAIHKVESTGSRGVILRGLSDPIPTGRTFWKDLRNLW